MTDLKKREAELRRIIEKNKSVVEDYRDTHKAEFWEPWPHQAKALQYLVGGKKIILLQGGNRIGKTVFGANIGAAMSLGVRPWDKGPVDWIRKPPTRGRIICVDWEHHAKEVVVPTLKEWFPAGSYFTRKNNSGVEAYWTFPETGSTIEILTQIQETRLQEGWKGDWVWSDEPLPKDKYTVNRRGLVDYSGVFIMTMTSMYEPWILDEIVLSNNPIVGAVLDIPMRANPLLRQEDIDNYAADLTDDEKAVRIDGGWLQRQGLILKEFNKDIHKVPTKKVPTDWPVIALIDLHLTTENAIGFYGFDPYNRLFVVDEFFEHSTPEEIADEIIRRKTTNVWRMKNVYIDPFAKGDASFIRNRFKVEDSYRIIERKLRQAGIRLDVGSKDKDSGIRNIRRLLMTPAGIPALFIQEHCKRHLWEIQRWIYDKNQKPIKENDHMMENLYRATLTGTKYVAPGAMKGALNYKAAGVV